LLRIDEILTAVNNALNGCSGQVTPTPAHSISGAIRHYSNGVPVSGVVVELKGATTLSAQTAANGGRRYSPASCSARRTTSSLIQHLAFVRSCSSNGAIIETSPRRLVAPIREV
jgi:hypothetical protein